MTTETETVNQTPALTIEALMQAKAQGLRDDVLFRDSEAHRQHFEAEKERINREIACLEEAVLDGEQLIEFWKASIKALEKERDDNVTTIMHIRRKAREGRDKLAMIERFLAGRSAS